MDVVLQMGNIVPRSWCKLDWLVGCWRFSSWQHLRSYQDGYRLVTMCTYHQCRSPAPWPDIPLSHLILCLPYANNAERLARKWQVLIFKSLLWLDKCSSSCMDLNHWIYHKGEMDAQLIQPSHLVWCELDKRFTLPKLRVNDCPVYTLLKYDV